MTTETNLKALYIFRCLFTTSSVKLFVVNVQIFVYNCVSRKKEKQHSQNLSNFEKKNILKIKAHSETHFENESIHLQACNHFKLYNGKAAEQELKTLQEQASSSFSFGQDLIQHNLVVFRNGEGALQTLPPLVDVIPEARLNLVIYLLKQDDIAEAYALIKDLEPTVPQEYILKGKVENI